jgi:hypothetical protein
MVDLILQGVRRLLGDVIAKIEHIAAYGPLLAAMDADSLAWCRGAVGVPDITVVKAIACGESKAVTFDLLATRHLVLRMQACLLAVPSAGGSRDVRWEERKEKCDSLLLLCSNLVPAQTLLPAYSR